MRNIALLEWGPASLFHIQPREKIRVRTPWLDGGPVLPPFLSTADEVKANTPETGVRYALSAYEDLNGAIRNLRKCFGFPYQEFIGYLNTLTRTHRARREHEALIDRIRRWAMFSNVDAIVWIDYAKSNLPPGSFKVGARDSRPFSKKHMEICTHDPAETKHDNDDESETWSEIEYEHGAAGGPATSTAADPVVGMTTSLDFSQPSSGSGPLMIPVRAQQRVARTGARQHSLKRNTQLESGGGPSRTSLSASVALSKQQDSASAAVAGASVTEGTKPVEDADAPKPKPDERTLLRSMIQEEVVPAHGSIYTRSIAPGPGYYGTPATAGSQSARGSSFTGRGRGQLEDILLKAGKTPGPGDYIPKKAIADAPKTLGRFDRAQRLVLPVDVPKKLPFISSIASQSEGHGLQSPSEFHSVSPDAPCIGRGVMRSPRYSFSRSRRPF